MAAIDLSAAFDTVDHEVLLNVLEAKFGITGAALKWFESYLLDRKCKVQIGDIYSISKNLQFSVPQGSCMGPILYLAYASTLQEIIPTQISVYGYADDHALATNFKANDKTSERQSITQLEKCMDNIKDWMDLNRLKMNSAKTEFILFGQTKQLQKTDTHAIEVVDDTIERSDSVKYLGVYLDKTLSMDKHISHICRICMLNLQRIKLIRSFLSVDSCKILVQCLVISHLDYANAILATLPKSHLNKLQRVQNYAAKLILKCHIRDSSTESLKQLHWLPVHARIDFKILTLVFKCLHDSAPLYLKSLINYRVNVRSGLRSARDDKILEIPFTRSSKFADRSFSVCGPKIWNKLPYNIRNCSNLARFKRELKTHLFIREYN